MADNMGMSSGKVRVETLDETLGIVLVTIDCPPVNAINLELYRSIQATFEGLKFQNGVRCCILTGAGERAFVAGSDIDEFLELTPLNAPIRSATVRRAFTAIRECEVPVVGAINGAALGAGIAMAASCDILVASDTAVFGLPEIGVGVLGGTRHLSRLLPPLLVRRMALTGHRITAAELATHGGLSAVVTADKLMDEALRIAADVAKHNVHALRLQKQTLNLVEHMSLSDGYQVEQYATGLLSGTPDSKTLARSIRSGGRKANRS